MNNYTRIEIAVGSFVLLCLTGLGYLSVSIGGASLWPTDRFAVSARFASVGDLTAGAVVKLAGVPVGEVTAIALEDYVAKVTMRVDRSIELPTDTIASVKTEGLLGEAYVSLSPGASLQNLKDGDRITQTQPPLDLFELVEKYAFENDGEDANGEAARGSAADAGKPSPFPDPLE
jgi:phospholipid/cholesterol/gamma-HCH transport system substrate-binding protein